VVSALAVPRLHEDEPPTDAALVRTLLAGQFPAWAGLPIAPVAGCGTSHALYRVGEAMVARLPRRAYAVAQIDKEHHWLPWLADRLSVALPRPLARGVPDAGYPWAWSVYDWLDGEPATRTPFTDPTAAARALAGFVRALQTVEPTLDLTPGQHNNHRGHDVRLRDTLTRQKIAELDGEIDAAVATAVWDEAMAATPWSGPPVLIHGDLMPGNVLVSEGRLSAVIDFGCLGAGDPAVDLIPAWNLFRGAARTAFRAAVAADDDAWTRGRGWALHQGLMALPYYRDTDPPFADQARRTIAATLEAA
jgi:aminoglycoside phosphotransferase (APT) family kinase protein